MKTKKKIFPFILMGILIFTFLTGCQNEGPTSEEPTSNVEYNKYSHAFTGSFDTVIEVVGYTETEEEFSEYVGRIEERMLELHKLYDKYNDYEGVNNIKTINDNAGVKPVKVDREIIDLILYSKKLYEEVGSKTNIAMGSVLEIWHDYRDEGLADPENAKLPPREELEAANAHTDINKVIVDVAESTVYLDDPFMSLDVGSIAKGYATEIVAQEMINEGFSSGLISSGSSSIRSFGQPLDGKRSKWGIGIRNPDGLNENEVLDVVYTKDSSVVSSGDYIRYYTVGDQKLNHIIDPDTLMPGDYFTAVTIVTEDSGLADFLSTIIFLLPYEEGKELIESMDETEALWNLKDGTIKYSDGMTEMLKTHGATSD